ncbi:MAG: AI-2E family transporter, partial [Candidatus Pacearchaeota archaeon]
MKLYLTAQQIDFIAPLKNFFPSFFASDQFSAEVASIIQSFIKKITNYLVDSFASLVLNFPTLLMKTFVVLFTLFFVLRDKDELIEYIKSLLPFSKEVENKLFYYSKGITSSVIYGQVVVGIFQGLIAGIGFFIFGVPNSLLLSLAAMLISILPLLGPFLVWVPVVIYLLIAGNTFSAMGVLVFGLVASTVDNILRPAIVSRRTKIHSSIILTGMIGGLFIFGILGIILGPLILSYLLVILEFYRSKNIKGLFSASN